MRVYKYTNETLVTREARNCERLERREPDIREARRTRLERVVANELLEYQFVFDCLAYLSFSLPLRSVNVSTCLLLIACLSFESGVPASLSALST